MSFSTTNCVRYFHDLTYSFEFLSTLSIYSLMSYLESPPAISFNLLLNRYFEVCYPRPLDTQYFKPREITYIYIIEEAERAVVPW